MNEHTFHYDYYGLGQIIPPYRVRSVAIDRGWTPTNLDDACWWVMQIPVTYA